jgi:hypothetical protein
VKRTKLSGESLKKWGGVTDHLAHCSCYSSFGMQEDLIIDRVWSSTLLDWTLLRYVLHNYNRFTNSPFRVQYSMHLSFLVLLSTPVAW